MKVFFYASFNDKGNRTHLVHTADTAFESLPTETRGIYKSVQPQEVTINPSDLESHWWLCKDLIENLNSKGWDSCVWARVNSMA